MKEENKNVYQRLQLCRTELQKKNLKKSGNNKFAGFNYFELSDFLPAINDLFKEHGLSSLFNIYEDKNIATLTIINTDNVEDKIEFQTPLAEANIKGCAPIQSLGGVHTYLRRYLYMNALEIVESDMFDSKTGDMEIDDKKSNRTSTRNASPKQTAILLQTYKGDNLKKLLETNKITKIEDMPMKKASELIGKIKEQQEADKVESDNLKWEYATKE